MIMTTPRLILAPLAGVSDGSFREICRSCGAAYTHTEMISAKAVCFGNKKTLNLAAIRESETPCALQIFGSEPDTMEIAAKRLLDAAIVKPAAIDINMGCPVPKVVGGGDGSSLMRNPPLAGAIISAVVKAAYPIPVTVKIRAGWDKNERNAPNIARIAEQSGASAVTVHGRTRAGMYHDPVDFEIIAETKRAVNIPVIGNGGIFERDDIANMITATGCDGVMIARGAFGNPWIFAQETPADKMPLIRRHMELMRDLKGDIAAFEARKHLAWYLKGAAGSASARDRINRSENLNEMLAITEETLRFAANSE
ncbi:tRNA-dihydrouridine synthase [Clostridia bacterium]|nr:tRNA-dihydrouridine synthase [Clostridia bacterium]